MSKLVSSTFPQLLLLHPLLLSLYLITPISTTAPLNFFEKEALLSIMDSISSDRDWRSYSSEDPCNPSSSWPGLECKPGSDNRFHVTKLVFGTHPNPTCRSSATFPFQIFNLPYLQSIHFLNCFKIKKTTLFLPHSNFSSLQQLSLKANPALIGPIPTQISSLESIQVLTLSQNNLRGEIPEAISTLTSLIHLDLSYNRLTGKIPAQVGKLSSLVDLDLSYNSLNGPIPTSIGEMGMLQKLDLSSNSLLGSIPQSVENLKLLTFLALSENRLSGYPKPPNGLANLQNLQYLFMDSNPMFVPLPPELGRLQRLQELKLANSGYSGQIPASFTWLKNLTALSLEDNRLSGEIPPGLGGLNRIYHLNLSRNMLAGVVPFSVEFLRRLGRNLDLSGNSGLCFNGSSNDFKGIFNGVGVCGSRLSSTTPNILHPLKSSSVSSSSSFVYWVFGFMSFSAIYLCLGLCLT
ncbi:probable leucine-rich repeat receptor-like protein kinase At1g35710 [Phalaenopsis equestris]|uniref:probable leucine-rich repeat receptor-like protein kinase At1g35710 n=1 Tax=Phalaenopsis equestris TaxID=78828 RepID=UPI0009E34812|nr:probable leucine-rich repeat receptor-like protein kinase At1g35710 [Phalaenopsis equestris]